MSPKDVARLALATVKNGYTACEVLAAVKEVVKCNACRDIIEQVDDGLQALQEDLDALWEAILELLSALGIPSKTKPGDKIEEQAWWRRLLRALNIVSKIRDLVNAVLNVYDSVNALIKTANQLIQDVKRLMQCCNQE